MLQVTKTNCHNYVPAPNVDGSSNVARACAICIMESHIDQIKEVQTRLTSRGGIFESKITGPKTDNGWEYTNHQTWTSKWRTVKVKCSRVVEALEKLHDEQPDMIEEWGIDEALYLWELARDECCKVPGYKYVGNALKEVILLEDTKEAKSTPITIPAPKEKIVPEDDSGWATVTCTWKKRSQSQNLLSEDEDERPEPGNNLLKDLEAINHKLDWLQICFDNLSEALAHSSDEGSEETQATIIEPSGTLSAPLPRILTLSHYDVFCNTLPSALKNILPCDPRSRKTVMISPRATIIPSEDDQAVTQPHNEHAAVENRRHRLTWSRRSRKYSPSTWASPEGCEKDDTSYFRVSWLDLERLLEDTENTQDTEEDDTVGKDV